MTEETGDDSKLYYGFWMYLMTDIVLFATLFATYLVLKDATNHGVTSQQIFNLPNALIETLLMTGVTFAAGYAMLDLQSKKKLYCGFGATFILASLFVAMTLSEYTSLLQDGNSWTKSAFLSAYFTLSGVHLLHILVGLLWTLFLLIPVFKEGMTRMSLRRLTCLRIYWQFLTLIWIFVFTLVYLPGAA